MQETPHPILVAEGEFSIGDIFLEAPSPHMDYCVIYEDDGETGYFYALDLKNQEDPILDALHIYNVEDVEDSDLPSLFQIVWSADGLKAGLFINEYPHAVFDFEAKRGYCRTNYPPPNTDFTEHSHEWSDDCLQWFI